MKMPSTEITCPFCFAKSAPHKVRFRCVQPSPRCTGWENDGLYAKKRNIPPTIMGHVFEAPISKEKGAALTSIPRSAPCDACDTESYVHLCPECHFELPHDVGQIEQRIIAVIGGTGTGKSHYIGSLIFTLKTEGRNHLVVTMLADDTQIRWQRDFYGPVFENRTVLPGTLSAETDARVKVPLVFRLTSKDDMWKRRMQGLWHKAINTSIFDAAGEDMADFTKLSVENKAIIHAHALIFMIDPLQIESVRQRIPGSSTTRPDARSHPDDMLGRLIKLFEGPGEVPAKAKIRIPIAFVLSKIDALEPILDKGSILLKPSTHNEELNLHEIDAVNTEVKNYLRTWLTQGFLDNIELRFPNHKFFGISSLGRQPDIRRQLEVIEPLRVEEPFLWLLHKRGFVKGK